MSGKAIDSDRLTEDQEIILRLVEEHGHATIAARLTGIPVGTIYNWRNNLNGEAWQRAFDAARETYQQSRRADLETIAVKLATRGQPKIYKGELIEAWVDDAGEYVPDHYLEEQIVVDWESGPPQERMVDRRTGRPVHRSIVREISETALFRLLEAYWPERFSRQQKIEHSGGFELHSDSEIQGHVERLGLRPPALAERFSGNGTHSCNGNGRHHD